MPQANYVQSSFLGGEVSQFVQGRIDRPDYRQMMNVCLNGLPLETGAWVRRPGFKFLAVTRNGAAARVQAFDFRASAPYNIEFTDGMLRFFDATELVMTNDQRGITSISSANPAKVLTATHGWVTGDQVYFNSLGTHNPLLQNRPFTITVTSATEFTIADGITGVSIDGSTLGTFVSGNVTRVLQIPAPYVGDLWQSVRMILADVPRSNSTTPGAVMLQAQIKPYVLQVTTEPTDTAFAAFSFESAVFKDGPYFDPVPGGTLATPSGLTGNISLTLSFNAYDATKSYTIGDYVTSAGNNYKSIADANLNHLPPNATYWVLVNSADAIGPNGFQAGDVGRLIRLYSEPSIWLVGTAYVTGDVVAYGGTYWKAIAGSTGVAPGTDITKWTVFPTGAIWTWGKIISLLTETDRALAGSVHMGDMNLNGGNAASFDGLTTQLASASSAKAFPGTVGSDTLHAYVGTDFSGATDKTISQATIYPSSDLGLASGTITAYPYGFAIESATFNLVLNLRGKATPPASASDGTLLGTESLASNTTAPVTIMSTDQTTAWKYLWIEIVGTVTNDPGLQYIPALGIVVQTYPAAKLYSAEIKLFAPQGTTTGNGVTVQILGDPLLYTVPIRIWRLGLYSDTTGWPTCGTYHEGRLWLSGVIGNRIDASKSNDIFNFAPTAPTGVVAADNAISYTFNSDNVNTILWMVPDHLGIVCGTAAGEWLVQASALNNPLTPTSIQAHRSMKHKCADIEPRRTGLTLVVVQAFKRSLLEFFADTYSGKFSAHNLAQDAKHLTKTYIEEIGYQQELTPIIWARVGDGSLIGCTYKRETLVSSQPPNFAGWHRHSPGSGRLIEYISVGTNTTGALDALTIVTNDSTTGVRHVEMLTDIVDENSTLGQAAYLDDAITPTSSSTNSATIPYGGLTLNGLWALNDKTVTAWLGGLDCGDYLVVSGAITVPYGDGVAAGTATGLFTAAFVASFSGNMPMVVGFSYTSDGQIVRPASSAETGARTGPGFAKKQRTHQIGVQFEGTGIGVSLGTVFTKLDPVRFRTPADMGFRVNQQFSGIYWDSLTDDYGYDGLLAWRVTRPYICNITAIGGFLQTQDKA